MKIYNFYSPNFSREKRSIKSIKFIIIHYTGMQSERESIIRLCNSKYKVSSHFVISRKGQIYRLVQDDRVAWHAGKSRWKKFRNLNKNSIGIELVNKGHKFGYENFTKKQILALVKICKKLTKKYKIKKKNIIGHSDIAPLRKIDPGEKFPWKYLAQKRLGIWHSFKPKLIKRYRRIKILKKNEKIKFANNLKKIGYCFPRNRKLTLPKVIKAFQRHYRQELINGFVDKETLVISQNLTKFV